MLVTGLVDSCQKCKINCGDEVEPTPTSNTLSHSGTAQFHINPKQKRNTKLNPTKKSTIKQSKKEEG
jgi:hypothetical protein